MIGNKGGGRPKDIVRERLAHLANGKGLAFLKNLMDGKVEVQLIGVCPHCNEKTDMDKDWLPGLLNDIHASVDHRLKGMDQALRFGVGTKDEIDVTDHPKVQQLVASLAQATRELFGDEGYQQIAARIQELTA